MKLTIAYIVLGLVVALIPNLLWLLGFGVGRCFRYSLPYAPFGWTALALTLVVWLFEAYGTFVGKYQLEVTHVDYASRRVPSAFDGYKVVHISDIHLSTFVDNPKAFQRVVDSVNAQRPNLVCFTGDLISLGLAEFDSLSHILSQIQASDGVMAVLGNHDLFIYGRDLTPQQRVDSRNHLADLERAIGWNVLRNEHLVLHRGQDSISLIGVDNIHGPGQGFHTLNLGDLAKAMQGETVRELFYSPLRIAYLQIRSSRGTNKRVSFWSSRTAWGVGKDQFSILLSHDPSHWEAEVLGKTAIDLTLSGHTHAAQIRFFGWSPASWMFHHVQGRYDQDGQTLYINRGIGCTLPLRIGCPAEITVITLVANT